MELPGTPVLSTTSTYSMWELATKIWGVQRKEIRMQPVGEVSSVESDAVVGRTWMCACDRLEAVIAVFHASGGARPIADGRSAAFVGVERR